MKKATQPSDGQLLLKRQPICKPASVSMHASGQRNLPNMAGLRCTCFSMCWPLYRLQEAVQDWDSDCSEDGLSLGGEVDARKEGYGSKSRVSNAEFKYKPRIRRTPYGVPGPKRPIRGYKRHNWQFKVELRKQVQTVNWCLPYMPLKLSESLPD